MNLSSQPARRPSIATAVLSALTLTVGGSALGNPTGGQTVAGQVSFSGSGNQLLITNSPGAIIDWQSFSIMPGELTRFIQQSASSSVLNRVTGQNPSQILGALQSNGHVFLINPNGILFGAGSRVDVNGLVASSLGLSNADFLSGHRRFSGSGTEGNVVNQGAITTPSGGQVYLIAPNVTNSGLITSPGGDVMLAAGKSVALADSNDPALRVVISAPDNRALNVGKVVAASGKVGVYGAFVDQFGEISADSAVVGENGQIVLKSSNTTELSGTSSTHAAGSGGTSVGGDIQVLGQNVSVDGGAHVNASGRAGGGTVLIGGDEHGANAAVENAVSTSVGAGAEIDANAEQTGNGGKVVIWSEQQTRFQGNISARGGTLSGNGGFVETSSRGYLDFHGTADLTASHGSTGTLLLDPSDITIQAGSSSGDIAPGSTITGSNPTSILSTSDLETELSLSNVVVSTSSSAAAPLGGTITVASPITWSNGSTLTLSANQDIYLKAPITNPGGQLDLIASGNITQAVGQSPAAALTLASLSASAGSGTVTLTEPTNQVGLVAGQAGQGFSFANSGPLIVGSVGAESGISTTHGSVSLTTTNGGYIAQTAPISAGALYVNAAGAVTLTNASNAIGTLAGSAGADFAVTSSGDLTVGSVTANTSPTDANYPTLPQSTHSGVSTIGGGNISLASSGNLDVADATVGINAGTGNVTLSAQNGTVSTSTGTVTGSSLMVTAANGVGTLAQPLKTSVGSLQIANSTSGDISVSNSGTGAALQINDIASLGYGILQAANGNIYVTSADNAVQVNAPVEISGGGSSIGIQAATGITLNSPVTSVGGTLGLQTLQGDIVQQSGNPITVSFLSAVAPNGTVELTEPTNVADVIAGSANGGLGAFSFTDGQSVTVGSVAAVGNIGAVTGISTEGSTGAGVILATASGDLTLGAPVNAGTTSSVVLNSAGAIIQQGSGSVTASSLAAYASTAGGIGSASAPLLTNVGTIRSVASQGPVYLSNSGDVTVSYVSANGAVNITSGGSLTTSTLMGCDCTTEITGTDVSLTAAGTILVNSGFTVNANGTVLLRAGYANGAYAPTNNTLTIDGSISAPQIALYAGGAITTAGTLTGAVTSDANLAIPTLDQCISNPSLSGCSAVLPSLTQCTATPTLPGCSVVLPTLAQCTASPTTAGCSAVLPSIAQCTADPTAEGCSAVLPTLAQCTATPAASGCSAVLPTLAQCTATPTTAGCSAVLPSIAQCTADPTAAGCSVVLPTLVQCTSSPSTAGCSAVLPTLAQCTISPTAAGCSVVLPSIAQCTADPTAAGCSAVLPTLAQCTTTPGAAGCSAVLPTLAQCTSSPGMAGCSAVLPTISQCTASPTTAGCGAVLGSSPSAVNTAVNTVVAAMNVTVTSTSSATGSTGNTQTTNSGGSSSPSDSGKQASGDTNASPKKLYCN